MMMSWHHIRHHCLRTAHMGYCMPVGTRNWSLSAEDKRAVLRVLVSIVLRGNGKDVHAEADLLALLIAMRPAKSV